MFFFSSCLGGGGRNHADDDVKDQWDRLTEFLQVWSSSHNIKNADTIGLRVNQGNRTCTLAYQGRFIIFVQLSGGRRRKKKNLLIYSYLPRVDGLAPDVKERLLHTEGYTAGPGVKDLRQALKQVTPTKVALTNQPTFDSAMDGFLQTLQYVYGL